MTIEAGVLGGPQLHDAEVNYTCGCIRNFYYKAYTYVGYQVTKWCNIHAGNPSLERADHGE